MNKAVNGQKMLAEKMGYGGGDAPHSSAKTEVLADATTIQVRSDGSVEVKNAAGETLEGEAAFQAVQASREFKQEGEQALADIEIEKQKEIGENNAKRARRVEIGKEFSDRNRAAAENEIILNEALTLAGRATQGAGGKALERLSQIVPGVDVTDEAALDSALKRMALDQLQKFKGPTTDFEFGVVQDISGKLGNAQSSNIARIKALKRNNWFMREQVRQYRNWKGDPNEFAFNFNEMRGFGNKAFTLQEIQNTAVHNNWTIEETLTNLNKRFATK
ncbi:MAG: hypothetical protein DRQ89_14140 [Epsilonproteobacteria bacterium]|nr:MAG: hypothetical protein DRQ89_14140 [Campylobacterota bacterium]